MTLTTEEQLERAYAELARLREFKQNQIIELNLRIDKKAGEILELKKQLCDSNEFE